jgi:hypothetical protein
MQSSRLRRMDAKEFRPSRSTSTVRRHAALSDLRLEFAARGRLAKFPSEVGQAGVSSDG